MPETIIFPNGLCLLAEALPHTRSISLGCFVGVGACYEDAPHSGVAHLIEHMCFKGTCGLPGPRPISDLIEGVGGVLDAETSYESTIYWSKVADIHVDRAIHVLSELVRYPLFEPHELEKERRVIIEEIRGIQDTPDEWIDTLIYEALWGEQPLGRDIAGSVESVGALSHQAMYGFWQGHYTPNRMVLSVAGNISLPSIVGAVADAFGDSERGDDLPRMALLPPVAGPRVSWQPRPGEQSHFCIGLPALSYHDADRRALDALNTVVGGGMSSRLFQELREQRGLAYSIGSYYSKYADTGAWIIYGSVDPKNLHESISLVLDTLSTVVAEGIHDAELRHVQERAKGNMLIALEDTWSVAARNGTLQLRYGSVVPVSQVVAEFEAVTRADVQRVARRVVRRDHMHLAVIGPAAGEAQIRALIENWNP